jgi:hypothetical protein
MGSRRQAAPRCEDGSHGLDVTVLIVSSSVLASHPKSLADFRAMSRLCVSVSFIGSGSNPCLVYARRCLIHSDLAPKEWSGGHLRAIKCKFLWYSRLRHGARSRISGVCLASLRRVSGDTRSGTAMAYSVNLNRFGHRPVAVCSRWRASMPALRFAGIRSPGARLNSSACSAGLHPAVSRTCSPQPQPV